MWTFFNQILGRRSGPPSGSLGLQSFVQPIHVGELHQTHPYMPGRIMRSPERAPSQPSGSSFPLSSGGQRPRSVWANTNLSSFCARATPCLLLKKKYFYPMLAFVMSLSMCVWVNPACVPFLKALLHYYGY